MTGAQYKNIILWTLWISQKYKENDSLIMARTVFDKLGVAFPQGNCKEILKVLKENIFLGWTVCSCEEAQRFANVGVVAIGMNSQKVVILLPDKRIGHLSADMDLIGRENTFAVHSSDLTEEDYRGLSFFSYSYGQSLRKD